MNFNSWNSELFSIVQSARRMADRMSLNLVIDEEKAQEFADATNTYSSTKNPIEDTSTKKSRYME